MDIFCSISKKYLHEVEKLLIPSLQFQNGFKDIRLTLINYTGEGKIYTGRNKLEKVEIREISSGKQMGFGEAHNFAFKEINPNPFFLIINTGYLHSDGLKNLTKLFSKDVGLVEARQLPFSHPKEYNSITKETPWASGACVLVNSEFFKAVNGFDENFWMYNEDVDLSWRAWIEGYKVLFQEEAGFYHYTGGYFKYHKSRYYLEHYWSIRNFLYLCYKFWGISGLRKAKYFIKAESGMDKNLIKEIYEDFDTFKKSLSERGLVSKDTPSLPGQIKVLGLNKFHNFNNSSD